MGAYLVRRLFLMLLTLFGISVIIFALLRVMPGNIVDILYDAAGYVNPREKAKIEAELGLDKPIVIQYAAWIGGLAHGDLGYSYVSERPAVEEIVPRIPVTAKLAGLALCFAVVIGVPLGVISAVHRNSGLDYLLRVLSLTGLSMPSFWLGLLILMAFVAYFDVIPIYTAPPKTWWDELLLLSVPAAAVGFRRSALILRLTRSSMLEVLRQDYIRTARAKGASERSVNYHHALRNAILPVVVVQRYGRGRSMVFSGEASWRWRMMLPAEDRRYEFFWRQAVRWLTVEAPDSVSMTLPPGPEPGDTFNIDVDVRDQTFAPAGDATLSGTSTAPGGETTALSLLSSSRSCSGPPRFSSAWWACPRRQRRPARLPSRSPCSPAGWRQAPWFGASWRRNCSLPPSSSPSSASSCIGALAGRSSRWSGCSCSVSASPPSTHSPSASRSRRRARRVLPQALASCWRWAYRSCRCRSCSAAWPTRSA